MPRSVGTPAGLAGLIGEEPVPPGAIRADRAMVDLSLDVPGDRRWIQAGPAQAARGLPGGQAIAPGSLVPAPPPRLLRGACRARGFDRGVAGRRDARFRPPVPAGSRIGGAERLARAETASRATPLDATGTVPAATVTDVRFP